MVAVLKGERIRGRSGEEEEAEEESRPSRLCTCQPSIASGGFDDDDGDGADSGNLQRPLNRSSVVPHHSQNLTGRDGNLLVTCLRIRFKPATEAAGMGPPTQMAWTRSPVGSPFCGSDGTEGGGSK